MKERVIPEQLGMHRGVQLHQSFVKIISGSELSRHRLPYMEMTSENSGPVVWLTGCAHGDEVGGIVVIQEVFKRLRKNPLLKGTIFSFPIMNPMGFESGTRHISFSKEDLNRSFPGNVNGTLAERIAHQIFTKIISTSPSIVLDLHNDWIRSIPYTVLDPFSEIKSQPLKKLLTGFSQASGFPVVMEQSALPKSLSHSLIERGIPALTIELGCSYFVNEKNVEHGVESIFNILDKLEMISPRKDPYQFPIPHLKPNSLLKYSNQPVSSTSGILRFVVSAGDYVRKDQPIAKVHNVFGRHLETLTAVHDGLVLAVTDSSVSFPGAPVMAFGIL